VAIGLLVASTSVRAQPPFDALTQFGPPGPQNSQASLVQATDGDFYGTSSSGGDANAGTVFQLTPGGAVAWLYSFTGGTDGGYPYGGLVQGADGNLYGTTSSGGAAGVGTIFQMTSSGALTTIYSFTGGADGAYPYAGLIQAGDGTFFGTSPSGGAFGAGTVFQVSSAGTLNVIYTFTGGGDGGYPYSGVTLGAD
jgi:uncharacterized repeat protein (TIGR03803 family)